MARWLLYRRIKGFKAGCGTICKIAVTRRKPTHTDRVVRIDISLWVPIRRAVAMGTAKGMAIVQGELRKLGWRA